MHQVQLFENEWKLWVSSLEQLEKSWLVYIFPPQVLRAQVLLMVQDVWDTYPIIYEHKWKGPAGGVGAMTVKQWLECITLAVVHIYAWSSEVENLLVCALILSILEYTQSSIS